MLWRWFEGLVYHYEHARRIQEKIQGCTWRKAWGYYCDPKRAGDCDPIEDADALLSKMRRRYP